MSASLVHLSLHVRSRQREELIDVTEAVEAALRRAGVSEGLCTLFVPHTTAAVTVNENADPGVQRDLLAHLRRLVPREGGYAHAEGNSDAHIKSSLVGVSVVLPVVGGRLSLGTWQGVYFCEFDGPRTRRLEVYAFALETAGEEAAR